MQYGMTLIINDIFIIPAQNMKLHVYCTAYVYHVTFTSAYPMQISAFGWLRKSFVCSRRPYLTSNPTGILRKYQILHAKRVMHVRYPIVKSLHHAFEKKSVRVHVDKCLIYLWVLIFGVCTDAHANMHMDSQLNSVVTNLLTSLSVEIIILGWDYLMGIIEMNCLLSWCDGKSCYY